ncbi:hypothetical protein AB4238_22170, partial [Shewanella sp. 10N.286.45.A1]|uniref:hypothetical protein n=1 Tax=Shewanella sp. 10N.286.45.A1 TaxID=3229694 RepID=UPI0035509868
AGADGGKSTNQNGMSAGQALEAMGGVIKDHWKDILRDTIQNTRETSPVADALVDFAGAEEIVEGSINMAEGNIKAGVQSATVAALGKIKILRKAVDKISTGRTEPNSLKEKLAMEEVMSNPSGYTPPRMPKMSDTKNNLLHKDGWVKKTQNVNGVEIHYVENKNTKQVIDFKFKD